VWNNIEGLISAGTMMAVDEVRNELSRRDDEVKAWADAQPSLFVPLSVEVQRATSLVLQQHQRLLGNRPGRNVADPFVIGLAIATASTVVTEETLSGNLMKPRIPDVCNAMNIRCTNLVGFLREQAWQF